MVNFVTPDNILNHIGDKVKVKSHKDIPGSKDWLKGEFIGKITEFNSLTKKVIIQKNSGEIIEILPDEKIELM